jgi:hypothetical protein
VIENFEGLVREPLVPGKKCVGQRVLTSKRILTERCKHSTIRSRDNKRLHGALNTAASTYFLLGGRFPATSAKPFCIRSTEANKSPGENSADGLEQLGLLRQNT